MELQAVAGQLQLVNGAVQDRVAIPGLLAQSAPTKTARSRERDFLFIHLTLTGQPDETEILAQDLLDTISNRFYNTPGSVTASLRKAILESNQLLLRYNLSGAKTIHEGAITCAVMRANELFVAQAGEAYALLGHNFGIERLPSSRPAKTTPLGRTAGLDIRYYHNWLLSGDMLLLADPRLEHMLTESFRPILIDSDVEDGIEELKELIAPDSARIILVEFTDEAHGYLPDADRRVSRAVTGQRLAPPTKSPVRESPAVDDAVGTKSDPLAFPAVDVETVETSARKVTSKLALVLAGITGWTADLLGKVRSGDESEESPSNWALPAILAIAIPLIVAIIVTGVYLQRGRVARYSELRREISDTIILAQQADSEEASELLYSEALSLIAEAEELRPGDGDLSSFRQNIYLGFDGLSGVSRLNSTLLQQYEANSSLASVEFGEALSGEIYVLDRGNNRVYREIMGEDLSSSGTGEPEIVLFEDQVIGSHILGTLVDILWRPGGNQVTRDGLAALDLRGALITYFSNFADTRAVPLALSSEWNQPVAITTFNERLYILDPGAQVIWRYFAEGEGFTLSDGQETVDFVDDADLEHAVDIAIYSEDGSVFLLYDDGRIRRYVNGRLLWGEDLLANSGLESPLVSPTSLKLAGRGLNSSLFVVDPGSDRIIQFSLGGTFLAQFKASDANGDELFGRTTDFVISENPLRIIVTAGNELYLANQK